MENKRVSKKLLERLPSYLDYLRSLPEDTVNISATAMAKALGRGDVQVRKDLAKISDGGRRRTGHPRKKLLKDIESFLDYNSVTGTVVVGAGKLGQALLDYAGFADSGLDVLAGFDVRSDLNWTAGGKPIYPLDQLELFCHTRQIRIGIITVPAHHAQQVADRLVESGIEAILNFAPISLKVPQSVIVQNENLAISLSALRMQLKTRDVIR